MEIIEIAALAKFKLLKEVDSKKIVRYLSGDERVRLMRARDEREKRMRRERENHNQWLKERWHETRPLIDGFADHLQPVILVNLNNGIRRKSLFSLGVGDVDFDNRTMDLTADLG